MANATISAVTVEVLTDLSITPDSGPGVDLLSAGESNAAAAVYHRINPYFVRPRSNADTVLLGFKCEHTAPNSVEYAEDNGSGLPPSQVWEGSIKVDSTRLRRTAAVATYRLIRVTSVPSSRVTRNISCSFKAVMRYNSESQAWEGFPPAPSLSGNCHIAFSVFP